MSKSFNRAICLAVIMIMILAAAFAFPGNAYAEYSAGDPCYEMAKELTPAAFEYLDEVYLEKFPELGLRAMYMAPQDKAEIKTLADRITSGYSDDMAKAQAIVQWIRASIEYTDNCSPYPMDVFHDRQGNCMGEAILASQLMRMKGIPAVPVDGWIVDTTIITREQLFDDFMYNGHAWIYAHIGGEWVMFDPLWHGNTPITDRDYMSLHYFINSIEGVVITYDGMDMSIANNGEGSVYANGKFKYDYHGDLNSQVSGIAGFGVNGIPFSVIVHQEYEGWEYMDYPEKANTLENGEVLSNGWIRYLSGLYAYENGVLASVSFVERDGKTYWQDGNSHAAWRLDLNESDYWFEKGLPAIKTSVGSFKPVPIIDDMDGKRFFTYTIESYSGDPIPVSEDGYIGPLKPGEYRLDVDIYTKWDENDTAYNGRSVFEFLVRDSRPAPNYNSGTISLNENCHIEMDIYDYGYTGAPVCPEIKVRENLSTNDMDGPLLKEGIDYSLQYSNNVKLGTATVKVTGKGVYSGTLTENFTIKNGGYIPAVELAVPRIYGSTRYETSLKAADAFKKQLGADKFEAVILACGTNYADALAGSYLSAVKNAPILLVDARPDHISPVQSYIKKNLKPGGKIYMLGGTAVVPDAAVAGLSGYDVKRLWGSDRYATNVAILEEAGVEGDEILVASGTGFADSLSASATGKPILLVKNTIQSSQKDFVSSLGGKKFYIIGGAGAVNTDLEKYFKGLGKTERIGGSDRYETSVNVAKKFFAKPEAAVLAYGANFPDGLCGGSLAYSMNGPLLLAANGKTDAAIKYAAQNGIKDGAVLGGPALISDQSVNAVFS